MIGTIEKLERDADPAQAGDRAGHRAGPQLFGSVEAIGSPRHRQHRRQKTGQRTGTSQKELGAVEVGSPITVDFQNVLGPVQRVAHAQRAYTRDSGDRIIAEERVP